MKKIIKTLLSISISLTLVYSVNPSNNLEFLAVCDSISECNEEKDALEADKLEKQEQLDGLSDSIEGLEESIEILNQQVTDLLEEIAINEASIQLLIEDIDKKEKEIAQFEADVLARFSVKQSSQSENTMLSLFMSSSSITDLMKKWNLMSRFTEDDRKNIESLTTKIAELDAQKVALEENRIHLSNLEADLETKKADTIAARKKLVSQRTELQGEIDDIASSQDEIDRQKQAIANRPKPGTGGGGGSTPGIASGWTSPTSTGASIVTTAFNSPTYQAIYGRTHPAVDIASYGGANIPIYSINGGTVIAAGWDPYDVFGNRIVISHYVDGVEFVSVYAHLSSIGVSYGDNVSSGQYIGNMGNTGLSFGTHLHIELLRGVSYFDMSKGFRQTYGVDLLNYTGYVYDMTWDAI